MRYWTTNICEENKYIYCHEHDANVYARSVGNTNTKFAPFLRRGEVGRKQASLIIFIDTGEICPNYELTALVSQRPSESETARPFSRWVILHKLGIEYHIARDLHRIYIHVAGG